MKIFRIILLVFNLLAAVGLVLTTLAGVIPPSKNILPSVMAYGFLPMLVLNVALVIVWLVMCRWEFLISVGAILIRISFISLYFQIGGNSEAPSRSEHPEMVTLLSFNVHGFGGTGFVASNQTQNGDAFLSLLREYDPDILCLQEYAAVPKRNMTDSLKAQGYNHFYGAHGGDKNPTGTVVFSKLPISTGKRLDNQKVLVEVNDGNRSFLVCCVHMNSYQFDLGDRNEIKEMSRGKIDEESSRRTLGKGKETVLQHEKEWKEQLLPVVTGRKLPLILAGDMNDIPGSWLYSQIADSLNDTYCDEGSGFCTTYNGSFPRFRIDMVFHSKGFTTLSYKRIKSDISDHYPVFVSLENSLNR